MMSSPMGDPASLASMKRLFEAQLTLPGERGKEGLGGGFRATVQEQTHCFKAAELHHAPLIDAEFWVAWQDAQRRSTGSRHAVHAHTWYRLCLGVKGLNAQHSAVLPGVATV